MNFTAWAPARRATDTRRRLLAGGTVGNELLTATTGVALLVLLAVEGVTIIFLHQLLVVHLLVGVVLVPPTLLKLAATGYRFVHYYAGTERYVRRGPPPLALRATAPVLVVTTIVVLVSGVVLLLGGPSTRDALLPYHKIGFIVWGVAFVVHLLGHLPSIPRAVRIDYGAAAQLHARHVGGSDGRRTAVMVALVAGVVLAVVVAPDLPAWLDFRQVHHHH
jgi:hypothetical protein